MSARHEAFTGVTNHFKEQFRLQKLEAVVALAENAINPQRIFENNREKISYQVQYLRSYFLTKTSDGVHFLPQEDSHEMGEFPEQIDQLLQQGRAVFYFSELSDPVIHIGGERIIKEGNFFALHVFVPGLDRTWAEENIFLLRNYNPLLKDQLQKTILEKKNILDSKREGDNIISFNSQIDVMDSPSHILANSFLESVGWQMIVPKHKNEYPEFIRQIYALDESRRKTHDSKAKHFVLEQYVIENQIYANDPILMARVRLNSSARSSERMAVLDERDLTVKSWINEGKTGANVASISLSSRTAEKHLLPHQTVEITMVESDGTVRQITLIVPVSVDLAGFLNTNVQMSLADAHSLIKQLAPDAYQEIFNNSPALPEIQTPAVPLLRKPSIPLTFNMSPHAPGGMNLDGIQTQTTTRTSHADRLTFSWLVIPAAIVSSLIAENTISPVLPPVNLGDDLTPPTVNDKAVFVDISNSICQPELVKNPNSESLDLPTDEHDSLRLNDFPSDQPPILDNGPVGGGGRVLPEEFITDWSMTEVRYLEIIKARENFHPDRVENIGQNNTLQKVDQIGGTEILTEPEQERSETNKEFVIYASTIEISTSRPEQEIKQTLSVSTVGGQAKEDEQFLLASIQNSTTECCSINLGKNEADNNHQLSKITIENKKGIINEEKNPLSEENNLSTKKVLQVTDTPVNQDEIREINQISNEQSIPHKRPVYLPEEIAQLFLSLQNSTQIHIPKNNREAITNMPSWLAKMFLTGKSLSEFGEFDDITDGGKNIGETPVIGKQEIDKTYAQKVEEHGRQLQKQTMVQKLLKTKTNLAFVSLLFLIKLRLLQNLKSTANIKNLLLTDTLLLFLVNPNLFLLPKGQLKLKS